MGELGLTSLSLDPNMTLGDVLEASFPECDVVAKLEQAAAFIDNLLARWTPRKA
jgi:hypothetical protein